MTSYPFRKKPIEITAVRWWPGKRVDGVIEHPARSVGVGAAFVSTVNGPVAIEPGEWIITGIDGETYPCKDEIFRKTYDCMTCGGSGIVLVDCDDPQHGDSTWDHACNDGSDPCPACNEVTR